MSQVYDYVVIGSGAGGGTIAARLAEAGYSVAVIEGGSDPLRCGKDRAGVDYRVPAFHPMASENPGFDWPYYVRHFDDEARCERDGNWGPHGIYYPRAAALGGCTAHHAMIFLTPPDSDWDTLAAATGDSGWSAAAMRRHRRALEACRHRPLRRLLARLGIDPTGHGWRGWLRVERAMPLKALADLPLLWMLVRLALEDLGRNRGWLRRLGLFLTDFGDPNDVRRAGGEQLCYLPLATYRHARGGTRERLLDVARRHPDRLHLRTESWASAILFGGDRATGVLVERCPGRQHDPSRPAEQVEIVAARREVIVAAGAFETPKLLMLSGIGDPAALAACGIAPRIALPAVGRNLQDRYEIGIVHRMATPWASLRGARFDVHDPLYRRWRWWRGGMYTSNGCAIAALRRSSRADGANPDLVLMGLLGRFSGYRKGYAAAIWPGLNGFTWAILKGGTRNRAGSVTLNPANPRGAPIINFRNFAEGGAADLDALVEGVTMARSLAAPLIAAGLIAEEEIPGSGLTGPALRDWVADHAWGHHACGTAAIGPVLDGQCRVHGVAGLRVVDASIFPHIPGLFLAAPIMLAAEKIAADILAGAHATA
nr:GMC family oxidoreductase [uncultured Sphingomonas sp.]